MFLFLKENILAHLQFDGNNTKTFGLEQQKARKVSGTEKK